MLFIVIVTITITITIINTMPITAEIRWLALLLLSCCSIKVSSSSSASSSSTIQDVQGPEFILEPPNQIDFSNTTGAIIECSAKGLPVPSVSWVQIDGTAAANVTGLRQSLPSGKLVFLPFRDEDYRQDIHTVHYKCTASNSVGTIVSREVQVRAVLLQMYDVHVYDTYVISGNTGVLKCHIPTVLSDYVKVVSWTRDETYVISSSNKEPDAKYIIMPNGDLHIRNARNSDATSRFRCQTINRLTGQRRSSITTGRLFVTDPKGSVPPRITDTTSNIHISQGEVLMIPCVAHGNPAPVFKWFVKPEHDGQHPVHLGDRAYQAVSSLVLIDPQISDGGIYICEAHNSAGIERAETLVTVTAPLSARIEPPVVVSDEKQVAFFKCFVSGYPVSSIIWLKNGRQLLSGTQNASHYSELRIDQVDLESRGMYQCVVKNNYGTIQTSGELRLKDAMPIIRRGFQEKILQPGPGLILKCSVAGSPPPDVTWTLDDIPVNTNRVSITSYIDTPGDVVGMLNISSTKVEDGGLYRCIATNKAGRSEYSARINIYGKPTVRKTPKMSVVAGDDIWINCPMYGYPIDNITWEKDGKSLPFDLRQSLYRNGTVKVGNVQRGVDGGKYTCIVRNKHGQGAKEDKHLVVMGQTAKLGVLILCFF